jgi:hypothetical protein
MNPTRDRKRKSGTEHLTMKLVPRFNILIGGDKGSNPQSLGTKERPQWPATGSIRPTALPVLHQYV